MAHGWSHSFSDTVGGGGTFMTTQEGFFEQFRPLGKGKYRGQRNSAELMLRSEDGTISLITSAGEKRIYNSAGRLAAIQSNVSPAFDVELVYTSNRLTQAVDGLGHTLNFSYRNEALDKVSLDDGSYIQYGHDSDQNLINATRSDGSIRIYKYGEANLAPAGHAHLLTGIEEDGLRYATFSYASDGRVASSSLHANGTEVETTSIVYSGTSSAQVNQPNGTSYTYQFGQGIFRQIESISGPDGAVAMSFERGRPISTTDRRGNTTRFTYQDGSSDEATSSSTITEASGTNYLRSQKTTRDAENRVIEQETSNAAGMTSLARSVYSGGFASFRCRYDAAAANSSAYVCGSQENAPATVRQTSYSYCAINDTAQASNNCPIAGLLKQIDSSGQGASDALQYAYFASDAPDCGSSGNTCLHRKGDLWKVTNALGQTTEYLAYDGAGRPLSIKDANGVVTDNTYHPRGWLTASKVRGADASSEADDRITRIDYWPTGLVKQVTQPDGAFTAFTYDAAHRLTDITDNAGNTVHYTLDNAGNRVKEDTQDAAGTLKRTLSRVYNQLGQLKTQATAGSDPTDFEYDANGNATKVTDALATATQSEYDPLNRLSRTLQDVAGIKADTTFDYDALDNLTKVTDPKGLDTKYEYNGFGDLVKLTSPDTGVTSYTYDSAGNRAIQTDARGNTTGYGYDALNRLIKVTYPTTSLNVAYTYDVTQTACASGETFSIGRLTKMQDGGAITQYCYNRFGDLVRKVQTSNGKALVLRYDYTVGGQLRRMTYPDGAVVDYVRNSQGQTTEVGVTPAGGSRQVLLGNASYYPFGPAAGWTYGNGRTLARQYDLDYRPQAIQDTRPGGLEVGFGFDPAGNLTALTPAGNPTPEIGLGYDTLGRLIGLKDGRTGTLIDGYSYDATGNRLSAKVGTATQAYTYPADSHRLSAVAGVARSYDATGNTTAIGGTARQYTYDTTGRMTQARRAGAVTMNYRYNGRGEQVRRFLGTTNTYTLYDEAGHWLGDYDSNGAPKQQAIWLDDLPVGLLANANTLYYIEPDHLGSPRVVIDPNRDVAVWTWSLKGEAFGNTAPNQDPDGDGAALVLDMRFPGQRFDAASGLNQNYFRDYEAATGRYGQSDPIGLDGGSTTYSYTGSSPLMWKDTNGLVRWRGNAMPAAVGVGALSVGAYVFDLTSQCVNGRKAHVLVRAWGAGFGAGLKYLPVTSTAGNVTLEDQLPDIVPSNLVGLFFMENAGVSVAGFGGGCNAYQMGSEWTPAVSKNGTSCSPGGSGLDAGIGLQWGKSEFVGLKWLKCDECSPVETPF